MGNMILLSFDIEEFDGPREHGVDYSLEEGMKVSIEGTNIILDILKANDVRATFFCTGNFAENAPDIIERIMNEGHEVACHGVDHWQPKESDFALSKEIVEKLSLHNLPEWIYHRMVRRVLNHDGYFVTYFHPWEFYELKKHPEFKMPFIIKNHSGSDMAKRLDNLVKMLKNQGHKFITYNEFVDLKTK